jgi:hypothetical protein
MEYAKLGTAALAHVDDSYCYGAYCGKCKHSARLSPEKLRAHLGDDFPLVKVKEGGLPCIVLRTSRFFPEEDDDSAARQAYDDANLKVNELLYRRADIEDVVSAHMLAMQMAPTIGFGLYIISATTFLPALIWASCAQTRPLS